MTKSSEALFVGARVKIARAKEHLESFKKDYNEFIQGDPWLIVEDTTTSPGKVLLRFKENKKVPERWSAYIGDILHNLRSALDHTAVALTRFNGHESQTAIDETSFPIAHCKESFEDMMEGKRFKRASERARKVARKVKPYNGGNTALYLVSRLNNLDKHVSIVASAAGVGNVQVTIFDPGLPKGDAEPLGTVSFDAKKNFDLIDGDVLFEPITLVSAVGIGADGKPIEKANIEKPFHQFTFFLAFGRTGLVDGERVIPVLHDLLCATERTIGIFARYP